MENYVTAFIILLGAIFISRIFTERGNKYLDAEKKSGLLDLFSKDRTYGLGILFGIIILYVVVINYNLLPFILTTILYFVLISIFLFVSTYRSWILLRKHNYPNEYIRLYLIATAISLGGMIIFFALIFYPMSGGMR